VSPAVKVENLWKEYVVAQSLDRHATFYDTLSRALKAPFKRRDEAAADPTKFWALNDVSFEVQPGEVVGIIGRNGAGKSTLLKVLSRITAPTKGRVEVRGRLASLLEVGTGFHGELSGRENIFLNGAILGMSRKDIAKKFDEIVAFAEVEKFIDTPVKRYSSGMYVRLAFAVAAHLDSDVLIIDEVLAVGDLVFQEKCLDKMNSLSGAGRTVLFVSHNHAAIARLCSSGVFLDGGLVKHRGPIADVLATYERATRATTGHSGLISGPLGQRLTLAAVRVGKDSSVSDTALSPLEPQVVTVRYEALSLLQSFRLRIGVFKHGTLVFSSYDSPRSRDAAPGTYESTFTIPPKTLSPGGYSVEIVAFVAEYGQWLKATGAASFSISPAWAPGYEHDESMGVVVLRSVIGEHHAIS
jgi:lipopolysaccharide transport system ATP-binding protein